MFKATYAICTFLIVGKGGNFATNFEPSDIIKKPFLIPCLSVFYCTHLIFLVRAFVDIYIFLIGG